MGSHTESLQCAKLTEAVKEHGKNWVAVATLLPGRTNAQCRHHWVQTLDPANTKKKGKLTPAGEDAKLTEAVRKYCKDWVTDALLVPGRTNYPCRQRWAKSLDTDRASNTL
jgi:hypothetical protein